MDAIVRKGEVQGDAIPPPSKSYTHRAFISASLSKKSTIFNPLISGDTLATLKACNGIGAEFKRKGNTFEFQGTEGIGGGYFNFENSGTTLRIFTGLLSLCGEWSTLDGDSSLRTRPNRELVLALKGLGAEAKGEEQFRAPFRIKGPVKGGEVAIRAESSQFISSLLYSLPIAMGNSRVRIISTKSRPYIDVTLDVLEKSGIKIERNGDCFEIQGEQEFRMRDFSIPSDFSSASYLIAAGILAGEVRILNAFDSRQGDKKIVEVCREMGADVSWEKEKGILIARKSELSAISFDAGDTPDLVPTIAILCATAEGVSEIYNAEHLRIKEIDRISGICRNLRALGVEAEERRDGMKIRGRRGEFRGTVDSFGDHRMALAFSLLGLLGEVRCKNAEAVSVSYPNFFDDLKKLGARVEIA
ncbi:MAG: 3-phosphoshikimate 1-carboxyvinyltransferase [Archaeoglobi archaeon]|nr:MAG: 3-phosphoshikimate 1-carboxyvinyltransferase [Archaeoglobi archaeon]